MIAPVVGEAVEKQVDGLPGVFALGQRMHLQPAMLDGEHAVGGDHVHMIGFDQGTVLRLDHGHRREPTDNLIEHAGLVRRQMGDEHERQPGVRPRRAKQPLQCFDSSGGGADRNDEEFAVFGHLLANSPESPRLRHWSVASRA